jgi:hypothetical protein
MRARHLLALLLVGAVALGCSAAQLKAQKDDSWKFVPRGLPDNLDPNPNGYGHPFRAAAFVGYPIGYALDWILVKPFYMLGGLAPEWFGLTVEDAQKFQSHQPELVTPQNAPRRFE